MLLPEPRAMSGVAEDDAHRTSVERSSASDGTATARGIARPMPAASEYTARASSSARKTPRNPIGGTIPLIVLAYLPSILDIV